MSHEQAHIPKLTGKDEIKLQKKTVYTLSCPKCNADMDVTSVGPNTYIECLSCQNVTWRPDYNPPWWAKTRNFVLSLIGAAIIGFVGHLGSYLLFEKAKENIGNQTEVHKANSDSLTIKK